MVDAERFYRDVIWELGQHAYRGGTAIGAAAVVKRVAREHGIEVAERLPLPRFSRSQHAERVWEAQQ